MQAALAPEKGGRSRKVKHPVDVCSEQTKWGGPLASDACLDFYGISLFVELSSENLVLSICV